MPTVYSYLRFSRPEQIRGDSQRRQLDKSREWAERNNLALDESLHLRDLGISAFRGRNAERGALALFLECIETGRVKPGDYLVLESLDRLTRQRMSSALPLLQGILRTGVCIVTINPERVYTEASVDDLGALVEIIVVLARAYEESAMKSERLSAAWANKRGSADKKKLTRICPQWLQLTGDRTEFEPIPERVEVVQRIFRMAADGMGANGIAKQLNAEQVPTFGRAEFWQISYIKKVLGNRAVLGEYQPHRMQNGKRTAVGDPIPDYFPAIVDESLFYAVQRGTDQRKTQPGRHGKCVTNLFTGLLKDARDGTNLGVVDKGNGPCLVSAAAKSGKHGAVYLSFPYEPFERSLLVWGYDLELGDVLPKQASNLEEELRKAEGKVTDLQHRIATVQEKLGTAGNLDVLLDSLVRLEHQRNEAQQRVERLKQERATQAVAALDRTRELIDRLQAADEEEVYGLRIKLRSAIKRFVKDIVVLVIQVNHDRIALADIELDNGKRRQVVVMSGQPVELPEGLRRLDIRDWAQWPDEYKQTRFEALTAEARQMMELEDAGMSRSEIAKRLKVSSTHVSRTLRRLGRTKLERKPADSERLMTWHPQGRGWVKQYRGKRYFIGLGQLIRMYPRMVTQRDEAGTWRAANRWWTEQLAETAKGRKARGT
ncbi:MAG: recombinase family protein [Rhodopirellula sp.]|nr:recombinase family protein [Rhodopirellula sp.]